MTLQNEDVPTITAEQKTDSLGEALFERLPAGRYQFRVRAPDHQEAGGRLTIKPGITATQPVFLDYNLISVEWSVREITLEDRYEITLNATFETDVPAAVLLMQPLSTNLPKMNVGDVYYGELTLTNYGLIRADEVKITPPQNDAYFRYEFLVDIPSSIEAKQRVTIPYRIIALQSLDEPAGNASGGGRYTYTNQVRVGGNISAKTVRSLFAAPGHTGFQQATTPVPEERAAVLAVISVGLGEVVVMTAALEAMRVVVSKVCRVCRHAPNAMAYVAVPVAAAAAVVGVYEQSVVVNKYRTPR